MHTSDMPPTNKVEVGAEVVVSQENSKMSTLGRKSRNFTADVKGKMLLCKLSGATVTRKRQQTFTI